MNCKHQAAFETYYLSVPYEFSERDRELLEMAELYENTCEAFDRVVCSARTEHGIAIPTTDVELATINRHARHVRQELRRRYQATYNEFREALRMYRAEHREAI
jgi:hypothetical protein